ncbi:MAG: hypothetical protein ACXADY_25300 [Candidatus Hodarchaeales archaeon]
MSQIQDKKFRPRIDDGLAAAIETLFAKYPDIGDYFNNDKKKYVEDAIRRSLIYYENFKRSGATFSEPNQS